MNKLILIVFMVGTFQASFAQSDSSQTNLLSFNKIDFGFQGIGFTYEKRISNKITTDVSLGLGGGYNIGEGFVNYRLELYKPAFYFSITPKYFYNRNLRKSEGKSTELNSGNYIGLRLKYVSPNDNSSDFTRNSVLANIHWGVQRYIGENWSFNSHLGLGYAQDIDYNFGTIYPAFEFKVSYILPF